MPIETANVAAGVAAVTEPHLVDPAVQSLSVSVLFVVQLSPPCHWIVPPVTERGLLLRAS